MGKKKVINQSINQFHSQLINSLLQWEKHALLESNSILLDSLEWAQQLDVAEIGTPLPHNADVFNFSQAVIGFQFEKFI